MKRFLFAIFFIGCSISADQLREPNQLAGLDKETEIQLAQPPFTDALSNMDDSLTFEELFQRGYTALKNGNTDKAITYFKKAIKKNNTAPQIHFNLGFAYETKEEIDDAIEAYKDAILLRLEYPRAHLQLAQLLQRRGLIDQAITHYQQAVNFDPQLSEPALTVARLLCEQERYEEALPYFKHILEKRPHDIAIKFEYANAFNTIHRSQEALEIYYEILKERPNESGVLYNTAYTLKKLGRIEDAMHYYEAALKRNPNHSETHFSLGLAYLTMGDFKRGWPEYEWRWQRGTQLTPRNFEQPKWDGSSLDGKILFIHAEQGLGDTFQFIRFAQEIKKRYPTARIIAAVQRPLHTIISRCCFYIDRVITLDKIPVQFDFHVPLMTLPLLLDIVEETIPVEIPYITPDPVLVKEWKQKLSQDTGFKVGLCWQGNSKYSTPFLRAVVAAKSLAMKKFATFGEITGVTFYSLQKENGTDQLKELPSGFNLKVFDDSFDSDQGNGRFMDTISLMKNLDLIITIDTSVAHLAAAIGKPVWTLIPEPPDWRWMLKRPDTPWYPNMRLFRQPEHGNWNAVIDTIAGELKKLVESKRGLFVQEEKPADSWQQLPAHLLSINHSDLVEQLQKDLEMINQKFKTTVQKLSSLPASIDNAQFTKKLRALYLLSEMKRTTKEKIVALEGTQ